MSYRVGGERERERERERDGERDRETEVQNESLSKRDRSIFVTHDLIPFVRSYPLWSGRGGHLCLAEVVAPAPAREASAPSSQMAQGLSVVKAQCFPSKSQQQKIPMDHW